MTEPLTNPRSPLLVAGEFYSDWSQEGDRITLHNVPDLLAGLFIADLGQRLPGKLEDGTKVQYLVSEAGTIPGATSAHVVLLAETAVTQVRSRLTFSFDVAEGHVMTRAATKGLVGQWFTLLAFGEFILAQVVEASVDEAGRRVSMTAETEWAGAKANLGYEGA